MFFILTINNPFVILFEKTIVKYTDTESSSLLPVVSSLCDLRQLMALFVRYGSARHGSVRVSTAV